VREKFADKLEAKQRLEFVGHDTDSRGAPAFAIEKPNLGANVDRPALRQDVAQYLGGVAIMLDKIDPPTTLTSLRQRLEGTRQSEQFSDTLARQRDVLVVEGDENAVTAAVIVVADETATISENEARWETEVRDREWALAQEALTKDSTPASVVTFSPAIADTFRANALAATIGTFLLVGVYIWLRFKGARYSIAAIVALIHDVLTVIGLIALAEILYESKATHDFAVAINLLPFKIDLNLVAALLTIAGYSLNDTVVIMDRIRENKGKMPYATRDIINLSINQTFSRTLITGGTTMASCLILYIMGGEGMRAFAFALLTGLIVGTYSSVAVAAPIVWSRKGEKGNEQAIKQA
jgi:SecD/SecF fusion protein